MRGDQFFLEASKRPPLSRLPPKLAVFFKEYFAREKVVRFDGRYVVNTHFPPYPSPAFDNLAAGFGRLGDAADRRLYSVALAVTNRCSFNCWHCYNAGRSQTDMPLRVLRSLAGELQDLGAVMVTLTGGEPLLRGDLEGIAGLFDERSCLIVGTTGAGLTADRARRLRDSGVFAVGISIDSADEAEHDRLRGRTGAFRTALEGLRTARQEGLYAYVVSVATREFLRRSHLFAFLRLAAEAGVLEVHLLEPSATGRLAGHTDVLLSAAERQLILDYQSEVARDEDLPILSSYAYLESAEAFGCGAGLTHLYIDGSGEVCPCQLVPLSFGNVGRELLSGILDRMGRHFGKPRTECVGHLVARQFNDGQCPTPPDESRRICESWLPSEHELPRFFRVHASAGESVGSQELKAAYDRIHGEYDEFWLAEAARPIDELVGRLTWRGDERVFEAGCGTGYATALLARRAAGVVGVDLSEGMLAAARGRIDAQGVSGVRFVAGDAVEHLLAKGPFDVVFSSWALGYIPLRPFLTAAARGLTRGGRLAFVVHKDNSPREPLEIFATLVARDPAVLTKQVAFDFPRDIEQLRAELADAGLAVEELCENAIAFRCKSPAAVLEHLLKSGAGTAFYDAIVPDRRAELEQQFQDELIRLWPRVGDYEVRHDYIACLARRPSCRPNDGPVGG